MGTRFFCLCMSPALDATVRLPSAPRGNGEIFKDVSEEENVGGKTINVARWLAIRGAKVACGGLLGEDNDRPFAKELAKFSIVDRFVRVPGATRRNEMITWPGGSVKLNRAAFPGLSLESLEALDVLGSLENRWSRRRIVGSRCSVGFFAALLPEIVLRRYGHASEVAGVDGRPRRERRGNEARA